MRVCVCLCVHVCACLHAAWVHLCQRVWVGDLVVGWLIVSVGGCVWMCVGVCEGVFV